MATVSACLPEKLTIKAIHATIFIMEVPTEEPISPIRELTAFVIEHHPISPAAARIIGRLDETAYAALVSGVDSSLAEHAEERELPEGASQRRVWLKVLATNKGLLNKMVEKPKIGRMAGGKSKAGGGGGRSTSYGTGRHRASPWST